jgi:hypothetical protein
VMHQSFSVVQDTDRHYDDQTAVYDFLHADYDILQGIKATRARLPIKTSVGWVKGHQDDHKEWHELSISAKANCLADAVCTETHQQPLHRVGLFPTWVPGQRAALFHNGRLVTKKIDDYIMKASTADRHREYLKDRSMRIDPKIANKWTDETFHDIDWFPLESSLKSMPFGVRIQISKYMVNWTPTGHHLANIDNSNDRRCFACQNLKEDVDHVLRCPSDPRNAAREKAFTELASHFSRYYTPAPMAKLITDVLRRWFDGSPPIALHLPTDDESTAELHAAINKAYDHQREIGWGHFLRGRLSSQWRHPIALYYKERKPERTVTPKLWVRKTIDQMFKTFRMLWLCRNGEKHGKNYQEARTIALQATREEAQRIYRMTQDSAALTDSESNILHSTPVENILTWTRRHLDAYLATAEVILEQNVDPG